MMYWYRTGDNPQINSLGEIVVIDTETTGLRWSDETIGIAFAWYESDEIKSCYFSSQAGLFYEDIWEHSKLEEFVKLIFEHKSVVGHYFSFDARVLFRTFGIVPNRSYDTWHMAKSVEFADSYSLVNCLARIGIKDTSWEQTKSRRSSLKSAPVSDVAEYASKDAVYTMFLFDSLIDKYRALGLEQKDLDFSYLTYSMMARGFPINESLLDSRLERESERSEKLKKELHEDLGLVNVNSPIQVRSALKKIGILVPNTTADTLSEYATNEHVAKIISVSQLESNINSRLSVFKKYAKNGRLHAEWHPFGTASYRMVAKDPNLMAQPLKARGTRDYVPLAGLFVPEDKYLLQMDIAQAEVRLAAMIAKANSLAKFLSQDKDAYMEMAAVAYGEANSENRQKAKRATLASIYEEGPRSFSISHDVPESEAVTILNQFRNAFPEIKHMARQYTAFAQTNGYINLYTGRKIHFNKEDPRLYRAFNQEVQGGLAELMRDFMLRFEQEFPGLLIGQIHDSLVLEMKKTDANEDTLNTMKEMSTIMLEESLPEKVSGLTNPKILMKLDFESFVE